MKKTEFDQFLSDVAGSDPASSINYATELEEWKAALATFFQLVQAYLSEFVEAKRLTLEWRRIVLSEQQVGTYEVPALTIRIGPLEIKVNPVGTFLIGTKGRVDMIGPRGTVRFILVDKDAVRPKVTVSVRVQGQPMFENTRKDPATITWKWKRVRISPMTYEELTADSLFEAIKEVASG